MKFDLVLLTGVCLTFSGLCVVYSAEENQSDQQASIKQLIEALANKNEPPVIANERRAAKFLENYDWAEQARVILVWKQLLNRAEEALPDLVEHAADSAYCVTYPNWMSGAWKNHSVGSVCWYILEANVSVYQRPHDLAFDHQVPRSSEELRVWWKERKALSLAEIQLDAISRTKKTHLTITLGSRGGPASEEKRTKDIELLDRLAQEIKQTGKPIAAKSISLRETPFTNYPWPPER